MFRSIQSQTSLLVLAVFAMSSPAWSCNKPDTRWAASSKTFYIEAPVTCTLSDIAKFRGAEVLELVDPVEKIWLLNANLSVVGGGTLVLHGDSVGGDVNELRLLSSNDPADYVRVRARWGNIDIRSTHIQSWDTDSNGPDTDTSNGRANIYAESILDENDVPRESRMDIVDSEINHLGHYASVSYGLVWKVIGAPNIVPDLYDRVGVYGSLIRSHVHDNYMGYYSYGAQGIVITDNEVDHNESYGIDPHDDSDYLIIQRNVVHDNGRHGIICSRRCNNLEISDNEVYRNLHGIMLHREVTDTVVENNYVYDNRDTGIVLFESHNNDVRGNRVENNRNGIRLSLGSSFNTIEDNIVRASLRNGLYLYAGSDTPETTDGRPADNVFQHNIVSDSGLRIIKVRDSDRNLFTENTFYGDSLSDEIRNSTDTQIISNLYAEGTQGTFAIADSIWSSSSTEWTASVYVGNSRIDFSVTDLQPDANYDLVRNGALLPKNIKTDATGLANFFDRPDLGDNRYELIPSS